uniref:Uncharacterized protein n=1 Tax=Lepeophtheirus salmonis TaxID=72036 RepID=A0A0K2T1R6_LEPSM
MFSLVSSLTSSSKNKRVAASSVEYHK